MLIRQHTHNESTAQLMPTVGSPIERPMPLTMLPEALAAGHGRVCTRTSHAALIAFITGALVLDSAADRLLLVRRARMSAKEVWPWLQDNEITFGQLLLPGIDITDPAVITVLRKPAEQPGLRIIRLRERSDRFAVPRVFGIAEKMVSTGEDSADLIPVTRYGRFSGLVEVGERAFWGINLRSDQNQTPLDLTKFNPAAPGPAPTRLSWRSFMPSPRRRQPSQLGRVRPCAAAFSCPPSDRHHLARHRPSRKTDGGVHPVTGAVPTRDRSSASSVMR